MPLRLESVAVRVGGLSWLLSYGLAVQIGRRSGGYPTNASASGLEWGYYAAFSVATLALGVGLARLHGRLRARAKVLGVVGLGLTGIALAAASVNAVLLAGLSGHVESSPSLAGIGALAICASTTWLGLTSWRSRALPRRDSSALLVMGLLTVVLLFSVELWSGPVPQYFVNDLPFALAGAAWLVMGARIRPSSPPTP